MSNVLINGRTAVHAGSGGILATVDVCKTQVGPSVVPIPYPNIAKSEDADATAATVFINGHPVCTAASVFAVSTGDQGGKHGGVKSGVTEGTAEFITSSPDVFIEGEAAVRMGDLMISNDGNTPPAPLMQSGAPLPPELKAAALNPVALPVTHQIDFFTTHSQLSGIQLQDSPPTETTTINAPESAAATPAPAQQEKPEYTTDPQDEIPQFAPPLLINLRNDAPAGNNALLSQAQLDYFQDNGNNALVFVHGYNVPLGRFGLQQVDQAIPRHPKDWGMDYPHTDLPTDVYRPTEAPDSHYPFSENATNGLGAHSWLLNMEYQLNRAAGYTGHDQQNQHPFQRIIGIAWQGDVGVTSFYSSTLNALTAGRRLAPLLQQLIHAGIKINLMSHSLGARVILTALNILADSHQKAIDHVFLWQPAVADNALSNNNDHDTHPFKAGVFTKAHEAAQKMIVLHSSKDNILGSVYPLKWWNIDLPRVQAGIKIALDALYARYGALHISALDNGVRPTTRPPTDREGLQRFQKQMQQTHEQNQAEIAANWQRLEADLRQEMQQHLHATDTPEYHLLAPIAINRVINETDLDTYLERLKAYYNRGHNETPRPALGCEGFRMLEDEDNFIRQKLYETREFAVVDQKDWLFGHSDMKIPSKDLFKNVYVEAIWKRFLSNSGFGLYSK